jgi:hypothetical protein
MSCVHHSPKSRQASWCVSSDGSSNSSLAIICVNCNNGPSMCVQKILHSHATPKILAGVWVVTAKILLLRKILGGFLVCDQWLQIFYSYANPQRIFTTLKACRTSSRGATYTFNIMADPWKTWWQCIFKSDWRVVMIFYKFYAGFFVYYFKIFTIVPVCWIACQIL